MPAWSVCSRLMLRARHTRVHSAWTFSRPRKLNRRKPSASLIQPMGASACHFRRASGGFCSLTDVSISTPSRPVRQKIVVNRAIPGRFSTIICMITEKQPPHPSDALVGSTRFPETSPGKRGAFGAASPSSAPSEPPQRTPPRNRRDGGGRAQDSRCGFLRRRLLAQNHSPQGLHPLDGAVDVRTRVVDVRTQPQAPRSRTRDAVVLVQPAQRGAAVARHLDDAHAT